MEPVNIHHAKTQLSQLLQVVEQGEEVVIAQPVAAPGAMRGQIQISANFDAPLRS